MALSLSCCRPTNFAALSRAAAKSAAARLRRLGLLRETTDWTQRSAICESCPLLTLHRGISYCGRPFLSQIDRDPAHDGCGCPTRAKAKDPEEHCPLDFSHRPAQSLPEGCTCKWCNAYGDEP